MNKIPSTAAAEDAAREDTVRRIFALAPGSPERVRAADRFMAGDGYQLAEAWARGLARRDGRDADDATQDGALAMLIELRQSTASPTSPVGWLYRAFTRNVRAARGGGAGAARKDARLRALSGRLVQERGRLVTPHELLEAARAQIIANSAQEPARALQKAGISLDDARRALAQIAA